MSPKTAIFIGIGAFVVGAGVGGLSSYLYLKKRLNEIGDSMSSESVERGKAIMEGLNARIENEILDAINGAPDNQTITEAAKAFYNYGKGIADTQEEYDLAMERLRDLKTTGITTDDPEYANYPGWDDEDIPEKGEDGWRPPYTISEMEFINGGESQEKVTITYYAEDDVLCDTDDTAMDILSTVGADAVTHFDELKVAYARNEKLGIDYEIVYDSRSYSMVVHGVPPDDRYDGTRFSRRGRRDNDYD